MILTDQVFGKPDPAIGSDIDADASAVKGSTGQMNAVPAIGWLVNHTLLDGIDIVPRRIGRPGQADALTTIAIAREAFVANAGALTLAIGASVAEAAVVHIPAMEACTSGQGCIPGIGVESAISPILVYLVKEFLRQL